jgi:hypothetical protein
MAFSRAPWGDLKDHLKKFTQSHVSSSAYNLAATARPPIPKPFPELPVANGELPSLTMRDLRHTEKK